MNLHFLHQNWVIVPEHICELGISGQIGDDYKHIAMIEDEFIDRDVMLQNAALIAVAPDMFKLLLQSLHVLHDEQLKHNIQDILNFVNKHQIN